MTIEENKAIIKRYVEECWNKRNLSMINEFIAPECPHHMNGPINVNGPDRFKDMIELWAKIFPDLQIIIEDEIVQNDKYVSRGKLTGTHQGDLQFPGMPKAIPPTGKRIEVEFANISYISDGKLTEVWDIMDVSWIQRLAQG